MTTIGAIGLAFYVIGALLAIAPIARKTRWAWTDRDGNDQIPPRASVAMAIGVCYAWPLFASFWLLGLAGKLLAPRIFKDVS